MGLLACAILMLLGSCTEPGEPVRASKLLDGFSRTIPLNSLLPELDEMEVDGNVYCRYSDIQIFDTTFTTGRVWLPAHTQSNTVTLASFTIPAVFKERIETEARGTFPVTIPDFQWCDGVIDVEGGTASGTITLHFSYPDGFPFERIYLHYVDILLPHFVGVSYIEGGQVSVNHDSFGSHIYARSPWEIFRSGLDITLAVSGLDTGSRELQENGLISLIGQLQCNLGISLKPEDARGEVSGTWDRVPLEIGFRTSDIDVVSAFATLEQPDPDEKPFCISSPFPALQEENLNHFRLAQAMVHFESNESANSGWAFGLFSRQDGVERHTETFGLAPGSFFLMEESDASYREGYTFRAVPQMNSLIADPTPDSVGFFVQHLSQGDFITPQTTCRHKYTVQWRFPLYLSGADWQKEVETERFALSAKELETNPGSTIHIGFYLENLQPFALTGYPVVIDANGKHHPIQEKTFSLPGGTTFLSHTEYHSEFDWPAESPARRIEVYFKLKLGQCSEYNLIPGQLINYGLTYINKETLPGQ